jgi:hypothetical protein
MLVMVRKGKSKMLRRGELPLVRHRCRHRRRRRIVANVNEK